MKSARTMDPARLLRFLLVALPLSLLLISLDAHTQGPSVVRGEVGNFTAPPAPPFAALQAQIDALRAEVEALTARDSGLRVFDGEGNDVGRLAGLDFRPSGPDFIRAFHVFLEDLGVTASYTPNGELLPLDLFSIAFADRDCQLPSGYPIAGIAGFVGLQFGSFSVAVTGTVTEPVAVASEVARVDPRGGLICRTFEPPIVRHLVALELHEPEAIGLSPPPRPLLFVGLAQ